MNQKVRYRIYGIIDCPDGEGVDEVLTSIKEYGNAVIVRVEMVADGESCPTDLEQDFKELK